MYSGKISFTDTGHTIRDIWTYFIRFILDTGYWSVYATETATGGIDTYTAISDVVTATALDTWYNLSTAGKLLNYSAADGTTTLVEGTDYTIDTDAGKIKFLTGGAVTAGDSVTVTYDWNRTAYILYSTGISGTEKIYIGFRPYLDSGGVTGYIEPKVYKLWQAGMTFTDTTLGNTNPNGTASFALWSGDTSIWLFVNQQRVILVDVIQTNYSSCYVGFGNRLMMPHEYNYPLIILASENTGIDYASASGDRHYIADSHIRVYCKWDNSWVNQPSIVPTQVDTTPQNVFHYPAGVDRVLFPLYVDYMQLDGVYYAPASLQASEDTITIGTTNYIVFEDVNRHAWNQFMAIRED